MRHSFRAALAPVAAAALALAACQDQPNSTANASGEAGTSAGNASSPSAKAPAEPSAPAAKVAPKATPAPSSHPWSPSGYALNGTEPFWGGSLTGTNVRYMTPDDQFGDLVAVTAAYSAAQEVYAGTLGGQPFVLTLTAGPCSNGMSDHSYAFTATLQVRGETRRGCADPQ